MNNVVYERIGRVLFHKDNVSAGFNYISEFEDSHDSIVITTDIAIDFVERGWLGDLTYWATHGWDIKDIEYKELTSEPVCVKDVLCARVEVNTKPDSVVEWTYTFLKY